MDTRFFFVTLDIWAVMMAVFVTLSAGRRFLKALGLLALICTLIVTITPFIAPLASLLTPMALIGLKVTALLCALVILIVTRSQDTRMIALLLSVAAGLVLLLQVWTPRLR